ncbi:MAG: DUF998 domain-containing protein [Candidatus Thorarchaeota archaeon]
MDENTLHQVMMERNASEMNTSKIMRAPHVFFGTLVILIYCSFTLISWLLYPDPYGPITHYLSRLGNVDYNPSGAIFYNLGCIITGILLVPFFIGLIRWHSKKLIQKVLLTIGQVFGMTSGIALVLIGIFSEDQGQPHMTASSLFFLLNFIVLILLSIGLLLHGSFPKIVALYGIVLDLSTLAFELTIGGPITEWFTVFGALLFVGLVVFFSKGHMHVYDEN